MNQTPLLSGPSFGPSPLAAQQPSRSSRLLAVILVCWLLAGGAFVAIRLTDGERQPTRAAQTQKHLASGDEDLIRHLGTVMEKTAAAGANLRRATVSISRALPIVEQNKLLVEKRRLETALAVTEAARNDLETSRREVE